MNTAARRPGDTEIALLQLHGCELDPVAARLRIEALLGALELRPRALPPSAIVCVRELRDPLPGALSLRGRQQRPPPAWQEAMQRELERIARAAAWPARRPVPPGAEAVAFADEAELLACLASDFEEERIHARWWWRLLIRGVEQPRVAVPAAWVRAIEHAPAAWHLLAERGKAVAFLRALDDHDVAAISAAMARRFAVAGLDPAAVPAKVDPEEDPRPLRAPRGSLDMAPPWLVPAPEAGDATLAPARAALLGVALALLRAPALVRSATFAERVIAWREAVEGSPAPSRAASSRRPAPREIPDGASAAEPVLLDDRPLDRAPRGEVDRVPHPPSPARATTPARDERAGAAPPAMASPPSDTPPSMHAAAPEVAEPGPSGEPGLPPASAPRPLPTGRRARTFGPAVETALGGLFYLVNLAIHLGLYGDDDNLPLSPWDFIELAGERLLGARVDDPVWPLLAALAGREPGEPAGAAFEPPLDFRMPATWLAPFDASVLQGSSAGERLIVTHREGFVVLDLPRTASLEAELRAYGSPAITVAPAPALPDAPLARWFARLVPYLRARLRLAFSPGAEEDPATLLLLHRAQVHATGTHLDVVLSLETLPVSIRLAGLDRDPGWVAAAGRFIAFHFE